MCNNTTAERETTDEQDATDVPVAAYLYKSRTTDFPDDWTLTLRQHPPESINNIEYDNLQRLARISELDDYPDPIASVYELDSSASTGGASTHVAMNLLDADEHRDVVEVEYLAPIPADRDITHTSPPIESKDGADYFVHQDEPDTYFKVWKTENKAKKATLDDGQITRTDDVIIGRLWELHTLGIIERTSYEETLFSNAMYEHIGR